MSRTTKSYYLPVGIVSLVLLAVFLLPGCGESESERELTEYVEKLTDQNASVRRKAAIALGRIGPAAKEAVPALITALKDENKYVRRVAAEALGRIGRAAKQAVAALTKASEDEDKDVREAAEEALKQIKTGQ